MACTGQVGIHCSQTIQRDRVNVSTNVSGCKVRAEKGHVLFNMADQAMHVTAQMTQASMLCGFAGRHVNHVSHVM